MEEKMTKISMFATSNDTDRWAVCVDGYFGLFAGQPEAERVYSLIGGHEGDDGLADTAFGSAQLLPPGHVAKFIGGWIPESGISLISEHRAIDIDGYIRKQPIRQALQSRSDFLATGTTKDRLRAKRWFADFFREA
jgi:hypothetical protein